MSAVLIITAKGNGAKEIRDNLHLIDSFMNRPEVILKVCSDGYFPNLRVYYTPEVVSSKYIHDLIISMRSDKKINSAIKSIEYSTSLNRI